jgi:putative transposase
MAKRKGRSMNLKKVYRLYREEGLAVRGRRGRKRALGLRALTCSPEFPPSDS